MNRPRRSRSPLALGLLAVLAASAPPGPARGEEPGAAPSGEAPVPPGGPGSGACHADVQRLCHAAKGTPGGVGSCLREHLDELAPACREQIQARSGRMRGTGARVRAACRTEMAELCDGMQPGPVLVSCLRQHEAQLSKGCREWLPPRGRGRGASGAAGP